jgi:hypothetical protein
LDGLGYRPIAVVGSKMEFLEWIGEAVKERTIDIPDAGGSILWRSFSAPRLADSFVLET